MARKTKPLIERLMAKVAKSDSGCWLWTGTINGAGYGTIGLGSKEAGKGFVHRVSHELHIGPIPDGQAVCHKCDVKLCVNPDHLFAGTQGDNMQDMKSKGRTCSGSRWNESAHPEAICKGEKHGMVKLTEDEVREIARLFNDEGMNKARIARMFGVCRATVRNIVNRKNWKHLEI